MLKAKQSNTTNLPIIPSPCELLGQPEPLGEITIPDGVFLPGLDCSDLYALRLLGHCLEPVATNGEHAIISPTKPCEPGDFVVLLFEDERGPLIRRLVIPSLVPVGTPIEPGATLCPMIIVESLSPRHMVQFRSDKLKAMHRVIGFLKRDGSMAELPAPVRMRAVQ